MLRTEADVVRALQGCHTIEDIYAACEREADTGRDRGRDRIPDHGGDLVWRRRARGALQALRRSGQARRLRAGTWLINAPAPRATVYLLIGLDSSLREVELRIEEACELLTSLSKPADLILTDPPWGLERGSEHSSALRLYRRDHDLVTGGYIDVPSEHYRRFTKRWVGRAAGVLRAGAQLAMITGPQRAACVQTAAEDAGLGYVSSIVARRVFPLYHRRRPAPAHYTITVMCSGDVYHSERVFNPPPFQLARSGRPYPHSWWDENGRSDRPQGALRYDNSLPPVLVERLLLAFSDPDQLVCDPFVGSGTVMLACVEHGRRFVGGDLNPQAVRFSAARLLAERRELLAS